MGKYQILRTPLVVGNQVIKSRFYFPNAMPKVLQGSQHFPDEPIISFYTELARNGAAMICCSDFSNRGGGFNENEKHFPFYDHSDPGTENGLSLLAENVHFYGSKLGVDVGMIGEMHDYDVVDFAGDEVPDSELLDGTVHIKMIREAKKQIEPEQMEKMIQIISENALYYQRLGFDFVYIQPFSGMLGNFLNSEVNTRKDNYGGSIENRARFPLELFKRVKKAVGKDFLLVLDANNHLDPTLSAPYTYVSQEDAIQFFLMAEPYIDMIDMRSKQVETPFDGSLKDYPYPESLALSAAAKKAGFRKPIAAWTGFMELDKMADAIESGKTDMLCCARVMLSNPEFGEIVKSGRDEDLVPCVKCNKCHGHTMTGPWVSVCTVNPEIGLQYRMNRFVQPVQRKKRVAVVGAGPAGIMAAVYAAKRGHQVTVYEKENVVGGQLIAASTASFKWPLKKYLAYLECQVHKNGITLRQGMKATPDLLIPERYDVVIAALGGYEKLPDVEVTPGTDVILPIEVYGNEENIGHTVICVGGSEVSVETALHLAETGHEVMVLTRSNRLAHDSNPLHYATELRDACAANSNFQYITYAATQKIDQNIVTYADRNGSLHTLKADSVVAAGGLVSRQAEALEFAKCAEEFYVIGDCSKPGDVQICVRQAFAAAVSI